MRIHGSNPPCAPWFLQETHSWISTMYTLSCHSKSAFPTFGILLFAQDPENSWNWIEYNCVMQVAQEVFGLSRIVRTFGTEEREVSRYKRCLQSLRDINIRQAFAYLMYLIAASSLFNLTKVLLIFSSLFHAIHFSNKTKLSVGRYPIFVHYGAWMNEKKENKKKENLLRVSAEQLWESHNFTTARIFYECMYKTRKYSS